MTTTDPNSRTLDKMVEILRRFDLQREADRVLGVKASPLHEILYELTRIERIPGLDTEVWHAVVLCKAALTGRDPEDKFTQQYNEITTREEQQ